MGFSQARALVEIMGNRILKILDDECSREEKVFRTNLKFSVDYYEYVKRSMSAFKFDQLMIDEFIYHWDQYNHLMNEFCETGDLNERNGLKKAIAGLGSFMGRYDDHVKEQFTEDWSQNLTRELGVHTKYAIIVQALTLGNFRNPGSESVLDCSLLTDELQALKKDRKIGYVYDLKNSNPILAATKEADTEVLGSSMYMPDGYETAVIGNAFELFDFQDECFMPFHDFIKKCDPGTANQIVLDSLNEDGDRHYPVGVFIGNGVSKRERRIAELMALARGLTVYEVLEDGRLYVHTEYE